MTVVIPDLNYTAREKRLIRDAKRKANAGAPLVARLEVADRLAVTMKLFDMNKTNRGPGRPKKSDRTTQNMQARKGK